MSIILKGNLLKNTCLIGTTLSKNVNNFAPKLSNITVKAFSPVSQTRFYSDEKQLETVYTGKLSKNIKRVKLFSLSTSAMGILLQPYLLPKIMATGSTGTTAVAALMFGFFAIGTPLLLHLVTGKYITDIKYESSKNMYTATSFSIFVREKKIEFTPDDVEQCGLSQMMTTCFVKGKPIFLDAESFTDIKHYAKIMGYDKPMNFELALKNPQVVNSSKPKIN